MDVESDVLIVGAGPTGLMLANQLARRGVRATIIDRHAGPSLQTRALAVHARTLEIYARMGLIDRALELGKRATGANLWTHGRPSARVPLGDIGQDLSPYPFVLILGQDDNERVLGEKLRDGGVEVRWNTELVGLVQHASHVEARIRHPDGTIGDVAVAWVAGCDGARSAVRELSGIPFEGAPYEHVFFVADTQMTGPMVPDELNVYLWRRGFHLFFPMRGRDHWRVVGILPEHLREKNDLTFPEVIPAVRQEAGAELSFTACSWFSTYRIHHRCAARFREGRCFLLGDAAHIHSPMGGQGMNTGLQDAYNLAWKLALVVSRRAGSILLDSFEDERMPVAHRLLSTTDRAFSLVSSDSWLAGLVRTRVIAKIMGAAMRIDRIRRLAFLTISQTGIRYPDGPLSRTLDGLPATAPRAGDRFPWLRVKLASNGPVEDLFDQLDDTRFNLIAIGQGLPHGALSALGDLVVVHEVSSDPANQRELARNAVPWPSFYLLRPDGHVGLAGTQLEGDTVAAYISECLHMTAARASVGVSGTRPSVPA